MANKSDEAKARAEANFRNSRTAPARPIRSMPRTRRRRGIDQKTAGLKAQRLARDEAERVEAAKVQTPPAKASKRKRSIKVENLNAENDG